jgi:hypothetical protein
MHKTTRNVSLALLLFTGLCGLFGEALAQAEPGLFGNLRAGYIHAEDDAGEKTDGSAIGGKLGYISPGWKGLSAGVTFYTTGELFDDENGDFFSSENGSYSILGEAYAQGDFGNTMLRVGRFELETPYVDSDDVRMVPNTFQGVLLSNSDITGTTFYLSHLDKWAGWDADIPERFQEINGDDGLSAVGADYAGIEHLQMQAWYYLVKGFANLLHLEVVYEGDSFDVGLQYGSQSDETNDNSGPDGDVWGVSASYALADFTLSAAYNTVSGTVSDGFGGDPFFTSADDHAIGGVEDQKAAALGVEYEGVEGLMVGIFHVDFDQGADETDYYAVYDFNEQSVLELIYTDMNEDGDFVRLMANYSF